MKMNRLHACPGHDPGSPSAQRKLGFVSPHKHLLQRKADGRENLTVYQYTIERTSDPGNESMFGGCQCFCRRGQLRLRTRETQYKRQRFVVVTVNHQWSAV